MARADLVDLYASIPQKAGLNALREALDKRENKHIPKDNLLTMAEFVLKNNYFEFNGKVKNQLLGTAIGNMSVPTYASIFVDNLESDFLKYQELPQCFGTVTLTMCSLSGLMVKKNLHHNN